MDIQDLELAGIIAFDGKCHFNTNFCKQFFKIKYEKTF